MMAGFVLTVTSATTLVSCSNNGGQTGVQDDGTKAADPNGALPDTTGQYHNTNDHNGMNHRVDTEVRDSNQLKQ